MIINLAKNEKIAAVIVATKAGVENPYLMTSVASDVTTPAGVALADSSQWFMELSWSNTVTYKGQKATLQIASQCPFEFTRGVQIQVYICYGSDYQNSLLVFTGAVNKTARNVKYPNPLTGQGGSDLTTIDIANSIHFINNGLRGRLTNRESSNAYCLDKNLPRDTAYDDILAADGQDDITQRVMGAAPPSNANSKISVVSLSSDGLKDNKKPDSSSETIAKKIKSSNRIPYIVGLDYTAGVLINAERDPAVEGVNWYVFALSDVDNSNSVLAAVYRNNLRHVLWDGVGTLPPLPSDFAINDDSKITLWKNWQQLGDDLNYAEFAGRINAGLENRNFTAWRGQQPSSTTDLGSGRGLGTESGWSIKAVDRSGLEYNQFGIATATSPPNDTINFIKVLFAPSGLDSIRTQLPTTNWFKNAKLYNTAAVVIRLGYNVQRDTSDLGDWNFLLLSGNQELDFIANNWSGLGLTVNANSLTEYKAIRDTVLPNSSTKSIRRFTPGLALDTGKGVESNGAALLASSSTPLAIDSSGNFIFNTPKPNPAFQSIDLVALSDTDSFDFESRDLIDSPRAIQAHYSRIGELARGAKDTVYIIRPNDSTEDGFQSYTINAAFNSVEVARSVISSFNISQSDSTEFSCNHQLLGLLPNEYIRLENSLIDGDYRVLGLDWSLDTSGLRGQVSIQKYDSPLDESSISTTAAPTPAIVPAALSNVETPPQLSITASYNVSVLNIQSTTRTLYGVEMTLSITSPVQGYMDSLQHYGYSIANRTPDTTDFNLIQQYSFLQEIPSSLFAIRQSTALPFSLSFNRLLDTGITQIGDFLPFKFIAANPIYQSPDGIDFKAYYYFAILGGAGDTKQFRFLFKPVRLGISTPGQFQVHIENLLLTS